MIQEGLSRLKALNARGCCLVGHPGYYTRFGFSNAEGLVYVSELKWLEGEQSKRRGPIAKEEHGRVSIIEGNGTRVASIGGADGTEPGSFWAPHGICVDSKGAIYVGEVSYSFGGFGERGELPAGVKTLQKLVRRQ